MRYSVQQIKEMLAEADEISFKKLELELADDTRKGVIAALAQARRRIAVLQAEEARLKSMYEFERSFAASNANSIIIGLDEVGRGSVAGPLAVGAVILNPQKKILGLNDSKQIAPDKRKEIAAQIRDNALFWTVCYIEPRDIDRDGMSMSLRRAFESALLSAEDAGWRIDAILLDGNPLHLDPREVSVVKGDAKCASIAAASIVAKVERDALMQHAAIDYPGYAFEENKGYASSQHIDAIKKLGLCPLHRASFCRSFMQQTLF